MSPHRNRLKGMWPRQALPDLGVRRRPSPEDASEAFRLFQAVHRFCRCQERIRVRLIFAWNLFLVGFHWNRRERWLLFLPLPMIGLLFDFGIAKRH